jgi:peptide/nickel transport system substrate-binding protein
MVKRMKIAVLAAVLTLATRGVLAQGNSGVLRMVPHSNLAIIDPIWTTAYMSRNHGYMIYDTLFGTDEKSQIKPQMVESWTVSSDKRMWTFKLRPGLEFHDGKPVTGDGLPLAVQLVGRFRRDADRLDLAATLESRCEWNGRLALVVA